MNIFLDYVKMIFNYIHSMKNIFLTYSGMQDSEIKTIKLIYIHISNNGMNIFNIYLIISNLYSC